MLVTRLGQGKSRLALCALLICGLVALLAPAAASAEVYEVDSTADDGDAVPGGECNTGLNVCTLRAAIEVANSTPDTPDKIVFKLDPFDGQLADTINVNAMTPLPPITDRLAVIDGSANGPEDGQCMTEAGFPGPCVGIHGPTGLVVESDEVAIRGLAITGALVGIEVSDESEAFVADGNWVGLDLKGETKFTRTGILIGPGSDFAQIGGNEERDRNVLAGNTLVGLDIQGASDAVVVGNYFGVGPDGITAMANPIDVEITDSTAAPGFPAIGNQVGVTVDGDAAGTAECDGGCNVIAGALNLGVDLQGSGLEEEAPATGPTTIRGNFVGLKANGTEAIGAGIGIQAHEAGALTIGGDSVRDANFFAGGNFAVSASGAPGLLIEGNAVGFDSLGNGTVDPPDAIGITVGSIGLEETESARVAENAVRMEFNAGTGIIHQDGVGADVVDNTVVGGTFGIRTAGENSPGNLIAGNEVSGAAIGIQLDSDDNRVFGNDVFENDGAGIRLAAKAPTASGNVIGGDSPDSENTISDNEGPAIENQNVEASQNEIGRNHGEGNSGLFIDLVDSSSAPFGPNGGIEPPAFAAALRSSATGTALPGARIRVFRKASAEPGELASFLGEAVADAGGNWKVSYPSQLPVETIVAATQTNTLGGTSELATATSAEDPPGPPIGVCTCLPPPRKPQITIVKGPKAQSFSTTARFRFTATVPNPRFECKLDKGKFSKCRSPKVYRNLKPGKHVFRVRAIFPDGSVGPGARRKFTVLTE